MVANLQIFYSGVLSDALHFDMGIPYKDFVLDDFKHILNYQYNIFGRVYPVEGKKSKQLDLEKVNNMLEDFVPMSIYFMKSGTESVATFGDITARFLRHRGCKGAIITGKTRDRSLITTMFPTYCNGFTCIDAYDEWDIKSYGEPIEYKGIEISTSSFIFADKDAVLVLNENWVDTMFDFAEDRVEKEDLIRGDIMRGKYVREVYEERGRW